MCLRYHVVALIVVMTCSIFDGALADSGIWEVTFALDVSNDGTVVGSSSDSMFRWTQIGGFEELPTLDHDCKVFTAGGTSGISSDGSKIAGTFACEAFLWSEVDGIQGIGFLPGGVTSRARAISEDGESIVGWGTVGIYDNGKLVGTSLGEGFRWNREDGIQGLGFLPSGTWSRVLDVSPDGSTVVGYAEGANGRALPVRWNAAGQIEQLEIPASSVSGFAAGASNDGTVVGGDLRDDIPNGGMAIRWLADGSFQLLGVLPGQVNSGVSDVSANGSVIIGGSGSIPIVYTDAAGMRPLENILIAQGVDLSDWSELQYVLRISPNGRYLVGGGLTIDNREAGFVAKLALWGDVNQDDTVDLLDISAFVDRLINDKDSYEADINQDGAVDLLDISPFVELIVDQ